eukprot:COSAG06_NODE_4016_length_4659_cov_2.390570_3_plen_124_part_01
MPTMVRARDARRRAIREKASRIARRGKATTCVSVGTARRAAWVFAAAKPQICTMSIAKVPSSEALRVRADRGDAEAAFQLAAYHGGGQAWLAGIPKDEQVAARYYKQACDGGHTEAAFHVAMCY